MEKQKKERALTEDPKFEDFFRHFDIEYLPFLEWHIVNDDMKMAIIEFETDKPEKYINKWGREQWKIKVIQDAEVRMLSGGKRLFTSLAIFCKKHNKFPTELGKLNIFRDGKGFDTKYVFKFPVINKKMTKKK